VSSSASPTCCNPYLAPVGMCDARCAAARARVGRKASPVSGRGPRMAAGDEGTLERVGRWRVRGCTRVVVEASFFHRQRPWLIHAPRCCALSDRWEKTWNAHAGELGWEKMLRCGYSVVPRTEARFGGVSEGRKAMTCGRGPFIGWGTPRGHVPQVESSEPRTPAVSTHSRSYYFLLFPSISPHGPS